VGRPRKGRMTDEDLRGSGERASLPEGELLAALHAVDGAELGRLVASVSRTSLQSALRSRSLRERVLAEIFRRMESHVRSERAKRVHAVVRWRITEGIGTGGFDRYESVIADGTCIVNRVMWDEPRVTITLALVDFVRLVTQQATPPVLFVTGKLKVKGDLAFAAGLLGFFDLPKL
jgi:hypothetical protein